MKDVQVEKTDAVHVETESISATSSTVEPTTRKNLTAKEQYAQLWTAIKADSRYCW
ncbi:unnamed protein product [Cercospora beticola]|nr:unnamed protein product [Cercospora beticola]